MNTQTLSTFSKSECVLRCRSPDVRHILHRLVEADVEEEAALLVGDIPGLLDEDHDAAHHRADQGTHRHKPIYYLKNKKNI